MAKFILSAHKQLFVRGGLVKLDAGEVETDDSDLIAALNGALDVEKVEDKPKRRSTKTEEAPE